MEHKISNRESITVKRQDEKEGNAAQICKNLRGKNDLSRHQLLNTFSLIDRRNCSDEREINYMERKGESGGKYREENHATHPDGEKHYPDGPFSRDEEKGEGGQDHHGRNDHDGR